MITKYSTNRKWIITLTFSIMNRPKSINHLDLALQENTIFVEWFMN